MSSPEGRADPAGSEQLRLQREYPVLFGALQRQVAWINDYNDVGDLRSALVATADARALWQELTSVRGELG